MIALVKRNSDEIIDTKFLLGGAGNAGKNFQVLHVAAIPAETGSAPFQGIPVKRSVHVVKQEAIRTGERQVFGGHTLALAGFELPKENALEIAIAVGQEGTLGVKFRAQIFEEKAEGLCQAKLDVHGSGDAI